MCDFALAYCVRCRDYHYFGYGPCGEMAENLACRRGEPLGSPDATGPSPKGTAIVAALAGLRDRLAAGEPIEAVEVRRRPDGTVERREAVIGGDPPGDPPLCLACRKRPATTSLGCCAWCDNTQGEKPDQWLIDAIREGRDA